MKTENRWIGKQRSAEEELLIDTVENNSDLFDDMLFKDGTPCRRFLAVPSSPDKGKTRVGDEFCLPDQLEYFSYNFFDFFVDSIDGDFTGEFDEYKQCLIIEPDSLHDEANVLCVMIHLHEFVLNDLPMFYHDVYLYGLYSFLKSQIDNLDKLIYEYRYIFNEQIERTVCVDYDLLFLLKSFDLDLKKGYSLGTVLKHRCRCWYKGGCGILVQDDKWCGLCCTDEEYILREMVIDNGHLFDDMLFKEGTVCCSFCSVQSESGHKETWYDRGAELPKELQDFSYEYFDFIVDDIGNNINGFFDRKYQQLVIDPKSFPCERLILHEMIHLHEYVLNTLPSMVYHDLYLYCLYRYLKRWIPSLDECIVEHGNIFNEHMIQCKGGSHDILFFLKSFDLDIKKGYPLGTVFGYGYYRENNSGKVAS